MIRFQDVEEKIKNSKLKYCSWDVSLPFKVNVLGHDAVAWFFFKNYHTDVLLFTITKCLIYDGYHVRCWDCNIDVAVQNYEDNRRTIKHEDYMSIFLQRVVQENEKIDALEFLRTTEPLQMMDLYYAVMQKLKTAREHLIDYNMTSDERKEAEYIINVVNKQNPTKYVVIGNPIGDVFTQGYALGTIKCVKQGLEFDYYLLRAEEKGYIQVTNLTRYIAGIRCPNREKAVYALLSFYCFGLTLKSREYHLHFGNAVHEYFDAASGKYRLELLTDHGRFQGRANEEVGNGEPIFVKQRCQCGGVVFITSGCQSTCLFCHKVFS